jgi:hypothetical protein
MLSSKKRKVFFCIIFISNLYVTSRNHLLSQVVLVLSDTTTPSVDALVLADHNILCNLVKQSVKVSGDPKVRNLSELT